MQIEDFAPDFDWRLKGQREAAPLPCFRRVERGLGTKGIRWRIFVAGCLLR